jgi:hypothetical protein
MEKIILLLITIILLYYIYLCLNNKPTEGFNSGDIDDVFKMNGKQIIGLIPFFEKNGYIACFVDQTNPATNNLIYTNELLSGNWYGPMKNGALNDRSIIVELSYDIDRCLLAVGMELVNDKPVYTTYKKETNDPESLWVPLKSNSITIRSICHDLNGSMIGISSFDGQIYEYQAGYWEGPVNFDKPMKKVFFDKDRTMLGIGLIDSKIYKKDGNDWRTAKWNTEYVNETQVIDCIFDTDGKLIAAIKNGILKQTHPIFNSSFAKLKSSEQELLTKMDILGYRCGIDFSRYGYLEDDDELSQNLNNLLRFKKRAIETCATKSRAFTSISSKQLLKQNKNQNLINEIDSVINNLKSKGF